MHSEFWLPKKYLLNYNGAKGASRLMMMRSVRRSVSDFVNILTKKNIRVNFSSGEQSYTDGTTIVISAVEDINDLDVMVGVTLHEASHIVRSQGLFNFNKVVNDASGTKPDQRGYIDRVESRASFISDARFKTILSELSDVVERRDLTSRITDPNGRNKGAVDLYRIWTDVHLMLNFLEDRRIDTWAYSELGGFRPYYDALYEKYFLSQDVTEALESGVVKNQKGEEVLNITEPTWQAYQYQIINSMNPAFNPDALPGLREIVETADIENITRLDADMNDPDYSVDHTGSRITPDKLKQGLPEIYKTALAMTKLVYENVEEDDTAQHSDAGNEESMENLFGGNRVIIYYEGEGENLPNLDSDGNTIAIDIDDAETGEEISRALADAVTNQFPKKVLDNEDMKKMNSLEHGDASLESAETIHNVKVPVVVYHRVTPAIAKDPSFQFSDLRGYGGSTEAYTEGVKMGRVLTNRLQIIQDESLTTYNRQRSGKIDKRRIAALGSGQHDVFARYELEAAKPVLMDISIDGSSSMQGRRWHEAYKMAVSFAYAADRLGKMRVRINVRASGEDVVVAVIYDSARDSMTDLRTVSKYINACGGTPEGLCFDAILEQLLNTDRSMRQFFVNLSDGEPYCYAETYDGSGVSYSGMEAADHTRRQINQIEKSGTNVMSFFIGRENSQNRNTLFDRMYGSNAQYISTDSISSIARSLNRMFIEGARSV